MVALTLLLISLTLEISSNLRSPSDQICETVLNVRIQVFRDISKNYSVIFIAAFRGAVKNWHSCQSSVLSLLGIRVRIRSDA